MVFQLNHDDSFINDIPDGDYEVIIFKVGENVTPNGAEYVEFDLIIRNDFEQPCKNKHVFHKVWRAKATGEYSPQAFNTIGKAANLPNGKSYSTLEELFADYELRPVRVRIKNETSEYNGKTYENVNVKSWSETKINGPVLHTFKSQTNSNPGTPGDQEDPFRGSSIDISDDDLPF